MLYNLAMNTDQKAIPYAVSLTREYIAKLDRLAQSLGHGNRSEAIRQLIDHYAATDCPSPAAIPGGAYVLPPGNDGAASTPDPLPVVHTRDRQHPLEGATIEGKESER